MKRLLLIIFCFFILGVAQDKIVRVYCHSWKDLMRISKKPMDIAAGRYGEWYDLVVDEQGLQRVIASGFPYEVTVHSLEYEKKKMRGSYLSYAEINDSLRRLAHRYPEICMLDSLPLTTYEGRRIYGIKISDNVGVEEDEPGFTIDGCHHSREWATPQAVLFFADSMLKSYGVVPEITEIINTTQIYCFPLINVDGYVYDYPGQRRWRKNREPFGGAVGTDPNRNYGGAVNGEIDGYWGAADERQVSHYPSQQTFCGAYAFSGDEVRGYAAYIRKHKITTGFSLHSYGEQVMYPWGYKGEGTPDSILYDNKGAYMAGMMHRLGGGTYHPGRSYNNPYPTCGNTRDWVYGYNKWVAGLSALFYGAEIGTSFYQSQSDLDNISRQVFKAAKYLAGFADSLILVAEGFVPPPIIYPLGAVNADFTIYWHAKNSYDNHPVKWALVELSNPSVIEDDLESGTSRWILEGFTLTNTRSHSGSYSFFSGNSNNMNHAVRTAYPYIVQPGDSLIFWCWYDLELNCDVAVVEVSENTKEWFCIDTMRYTGNSGGWIRKALSLSSREGKSVYFRFRSMTDGNTLRTGFYVDDISPVCQFMKVDTISLSITDTSYRFTNHPEGEYYYYVKGYNTTYGWGDYSQLEKADVVVGITEDTKQKPESIRFKLSIHPNPFYHSSVIKYDGPSAELKIYDTTGRLLKVFKNLHHSQITWGRENDIAPGIYFLKLDTGNDTCIRKIVCLK